MPLSHSHQLLCVPWSLLTSVVTIAGLAALPGPAAARGSRATGCSTGGRTAGRCVTAAALARLFEHLIRCRAAAGPGDCFLLLAHARVETAERLIEFLAGTAAAGRAIWSG